MKEDERGRGSETRQKLKLQEHGTAREVGGDRGRKLDDSVPGCVSPHSHRSAAPRPRPRLYYTFPALS